MKVSQNFLGLEDMGADVGDLSDYRPGQKVRAIRERRRNDMQYLLPIVGSKYAKAISYSPRLASKRGAVHWANKQGTTADGTARYYVDDEDLDGDGEPEITIYDRYHNPTVINGYRTRTSDHIMKRGYYDANPTVADRKAKPYDVWLDEQLGNPAIDGYGLSRTYNKDNPVYKKLVSKSYRSKYKTHIRKKISPLQSFGKLFVQPALEAAMGGSEEKAKAFRKTFNVAPNFTTFVTNSIFWIMVNGPLLKIFDAEWQDIEQQVKESHPGWSDLQVKKETWRKLSSRTGFKDAQKQFYMNRFFVTTQEGAISRNEDMDDNIMATVGKYIKAVQGKQPFANVWGETVNVRTTDNAVWNDSDYEAKYYYSKADPERREAQRKRMLPDHEFEDEKERRLKKEQELEDEL